MFTPAPLRETRCRVRYVSPLKALAVDIERNLRAPLAGIVREASRRGDDVHPPAIAIRSGDTPGEERLRMARTPPDILITTPESLFLILSSQARSILASVEVVILDEIHSLVGSKRGAHLALSVERVAEPAGRDLRKEPGGGLRQMVQKHKRYHHRQPLLLIAGVCPKVPLVSLPHMLIATHCPAALA